MAEKIESYKERKTKEITQNERKIKNNKGETKERRN